MEKKNGRYADHEIMNNSKVVEGLKWMESRTEKELR